MFFLLKAKKYPFRLEVFVEFLKTREFCYKLTLRIVDERKYRMNFMKSR